MKSWPLALVPASANVGTWGVNQHVEALCLKLLKNKKTPLPQVERCVFISIFQTSGLRAKCCGRCLRHITCPAACTAAAENGRYCSRVTLHSRNHKTDSNTPDPKPGSTYRLPSRAALGLRGLPGGLLTYGHSLKTLLCSKQIRD